MLLLIVRIYNYVGFDVYRVSYLLWSPVIVGTDHLSKGARNIIILHLTSNCSSCALLTGGGRAPGTPPPSLRPYNIYIYQTETRGPQKAVLLLLDTRPSTTLKSYCEPETAEPWLQLRWLRLAAWLRSLQQQRAASGTKDLQTRSEVDQIAPKILGIGSPVRRSTA